MHIGGPIRLGHDMALRARRDRGERVPLEAQETTQASARLKALAAETRNLLDRSRMRLKASM